MGARQLMTEEVNAAIAGAFAGGATSVVVNDSHGPMVNLLPELLDPRAELLLFPRGKTKFVRPDGSIGKAPGAVALRPPCAEMSKHSALLHTSRNQLPKPGAV